MENNNKSKNRSIKMTDKQFNILKQKAAARKLPLGKFLETICSENVTTLCDPNLICRLLTLKTLLEIPVENWDENIRTVYCQNVEEICVLLKW